MKIYDETTANKQRWTTDVKFKCFVILFSQSIQMFVVLVDAANKYRIEKASK